MADQLLTGTTLVEKETRSIGDVPIGTILSFAKSLTGVPTLPNSFVECNGQTLVDANSTLNGTVIPDLNGDNRFLRGNSTSGGTGGSDTMAHTHTTGASSSNELLDINQDNLTTSAAIASHTHTTNAASNAENRPPFYNVVWIMRVR